MPPLPGANHPHLRITSDSHGVCVNGEIAILIHVVICTEIIPSTPMVVFSVGTETPNDDASVPRHAGPYRAP